LNKAKAVLFLVASVLCVSTASAITSAQQRKRPFTVADEIELALFIPETDTPNVRFSPDRAYFAVYSERGRLDLNRPEDSLRFYRSVDVQTFLHNSPSESEPAPIWVVNRSTDKEGPIINDWRWLSDSSGVAFLERSGACCLRLVLADVVEKTLKFLTPEAEDVTKFDIRDANHYAYTVPDAAEYQTTQTEHQSPATVGTGRSLFELILSDDSRVKTFLTRTYLLRAVIGGNRLTIEHDGAALELSTADIVLSPDGLSLATAVPVPDVPSLWETLYPPPFPSSAYRVRAGRLDVRSGARPVHQYVRINLQSGSMQPLTDAPTSNDAAWWASGNPSWSRDGQAILLPGTFLDSKHATPSRPCVAVVDLPTNTRSCVETLKGLTETGAEQGYHVVTGGYFVDGDKRRVIVTFTRHEDHSLGETEYQRVADGTWRLVGQNSVVPGVDHDSFAVTIKQSFIQPPLLVASNKQTSRIIWNPNPQLENLELGQASIFKWKDSEGRERSGGLYLPGDYKVGQRYPLVIQTHGFGESLFLPAGTGFPTAFAARALAAAGIIVLQVPEDCPDGTADEGPCVVSAYKSAATHLVSEGLADPERIGIIGFSRSCFYVMEALTTDAFPIQAASITDGVIEDYWQYIMVPEITGAEAETIIGKPPFGDGLQEWLKRSPGFNLDKIRAPLLVVGAGPVSLLFMWEPYAGLRHLHKPVELVMLNTHEHVLTNPAERLASQGGSVDWFRFWLKGEEDPDPNKIDQYARWRELRKLQNKDEKAK
jgi:dipeptidyl aminopeptidase/acylaminoacyl peptidase